MAHVSRRGLILGGGLAIGAVAAGGPRTAGPALAVDASPALGSVDLRRLGDPTPFVTIDALASAATMQDLVLEPDSDRLFVSQAVNGSNGSRWPYETTVINRVRASDGVLLDAMRLVDAGHGLGFDVEVQGGRVWIWTTWMGPSADTGEEYDAVRLRYAPGTWSRAAADDRLDATRLGFQHKEDHAPEAVYHFDAAGDTAVERHFHFPRGSEAPSETYFRRSVAGLRSGSAPARGEITLPATPPTVQGFATVGGSLLRLTGATATGNAPDPGDPIRIEQYSWSTGGLVARRDYPDLAQDASGRWKDGILEPQGLSAYREADGTTSLLVGASTGQPGRREHHVLRFRGVGG